MCIRQILYIWLLRILTFKKLLSLCAFGSFGVNFRIVIFNIKVVHQTIFKVKLDTDVINIWTHEMFNIWNLPIARQPFRQPFRFLKSTICNFIISYLNVFIVWFIWSPLTAISNVSSSLTPTVIWDKHVSNYIFHKFMKYVNYRLLSWLLMIKWWWLLEF